MWQNTCRNQRNRQIHLNRQEASAQSTTGSRGVRISGSNAGYTTFRGSVKSTGYPLHLPVSPSLPLPCITVCHHISTGIYHTAVMLPIWAGDHYCTLPKKITLLLIFYSNDHARYTVGQEKQFWTSDGQFFWDQNKWTLRAGKQCTWEWCTQVPL
jgi:hypothetical protein